ncbi:hypothetical protein HPP92_026761 [Vanilla planifolia]|uniref:RING-type E3 ubiquitin transferase n=1 Tax=Vanilla planifolia TaxID=51239 RepID=A0A835PB73_VANPL|nr:hypothetical protein HPP92_026761 [Vanilla planifolia]
MDQESASLEPLLRRSQMSPQARQNHEVAQPPAIVRETDARQLDDRWSDWAYSRTVVAVETSSNLVFAVFSFSLLAATVCERPNVPLRVWIAGYALQCVSHAALVLSEYRRRCGVALREGGDEENGASLVREDFGPVDGGEDRDDSRARQASLAKLYESLSTMVAFIWWIVGFYWLTSGGEVLAQHSPRLYRLAAVFLAFDVCFAILFVVLVFVFGIAICCCLPCIMAEFFAASRQKEVASMSDTGLLPRHRYISSSNNGGKKAGIGALIPIINSSVSFPEEVLPHEYAVCCICLTNYEEGNELYALPCNHRSHAACVADWLKNSSTCQLCNHSIVACEST